MIIHRVHVRRFRKLVDQVLECGPGLNVIRGRNDAGKSTLHAVFSAAFFQIKPSEALTWGEDRPGEITIEFEADGRTYRLHKDIGSRKVLLLCGERRWEVPKAVEVEIGRILGLTTLSLFRATAHIGQWELAAVQDEKAEIGTRLSRIVTGGDSDAHRIVRALEDRIRRMEVGLRHPSKTPGPLKRDADLIARLAEAQARLGGEVSAIEQAAVERDRLAARITEFDRQVQDDGQLLDANRRLHDLDKKRDELSRRAAELRSLLDRIDNASRDLETAGRDEALAFSPVNPDTLQILREAAMRVEVLAKEAEAHAVPPPAAGTTRPAEVPVPDVSRLWLRRRRGFVWTGMIAGITALGVLARAVALVRGRQASLWELLLLIAVAALAGVIGGLSGAAASLARRQSLAAAAAEAEARSREGERTEQDAAARRRELEEAKATVHRQLHAVGASSVQEAIERQQRYENARRNLDSARRMLETLLGGRRRDSVAEEHQRVLLDLATVQAQRDDPDLALRRLDPAAFQRLQAEAERRKRDLETARAELQRLEGRLSGRSPYEDLARVEEELADVRGHNARLQRQVEVLKLTREVLFEAHRHTIVRGKERLEQLASTYLRALSGGAYERIQVDADTLAPRVWVGPPKNDGWADVAAREIGSGAVDQCYLALRLGLVAVLCQDRCPPLFMDDPFLAYDEERQSSAMALLQELARERQVFLFTCRPVYDAYADRLLVLGDIRASVQESTRVLSPD